MLHSFSFNFPLEVPSAICIDSRQELFSGVPRKLILVSRQATQSREFCKAAHKALKVPENQLKPYLLNCRIYRNKSFSDYRLQFFQ